MKSFTVDAGGPVHIADYGGSGPVMMLLHGLGGSHLNWMSVGPGLARSHRVLAPDLPGFGLTPSQGRAASIGASVRLLESLIHKVAEPPVVLIGNSMGGLIALGLAAARSDLLSGLVLVDPALPSPRRDRFRLDPVALRFLLVFLAPRLGEFFLSRTAGAVGAEGLVRGTLERCTVDMRRVDPQMLAAMIDLERERIKVPRWHESVTEGSRSIVQTLLARGRVERWIAQVTAPTLLMHGTQDRVMKVRASRAAHDLRPDWEYFEFSDAGHVPMMEVPQAFLGVVDDWLVRHAPTGTAPSHDAAALTA
ncbi:MAG: alpha/beta hydrolase [Candidatus Dormibacteraeota bacterium]|nr:alpha/beta hydrolase [Candidatus Dormibacteraeota bacterium]